MTLKKLETRVAILEKVVAKLKSQIDERNGTSLKEADSTGQKHSWSDNAGAFKDDEGFEEMVRFGREYRESLDPDLHKKNRKRKMKNADS